MLKGKKFSHVVGVLPGLGVLMPRQQHTAVVPLHFLHKHCFFSLA
jgi:hypothetical protein